MRANERLLRHMLDNLSTTRSCSRPAAWPSIRVESIRHGGRAVIGVQDDGPGLDRKQMEEDLPDVLPSAGHAMAPQRDRARVVHRVEHC